MTSDQRNKLPADVVRCLGGSCQDAEHCARYRGRDDKLPLLGFIQGGVFAEGVCIYKIDYETETENETGAVA